MNTIGYWDTIGSSDVLEIASKFELLRNQANAPGASSGSGYVEPDPSSELRTSPDRRHQAINDLRGREVPGGLT